MVGRLPASRDDLVGLLPCFITTLGRPVSSRRSRSWFTGWRIAKKDVPGKVTSMSEPGGEANAWAEIPHAGRRLPCSSGPASRAENGRAARRAWVLAAASSALCPVAWVRGVDGQRWLTSAIRCGSAACEPAARAQGGGRDGGRGGAAAIFWPLGNCGVP